MVSEALGSSGVATLEDQLSTLCLSPELTTEWVREWI